MMESRKETTAHLRFFEDNATPTDHLPAIYLLPVAVLIPPKSAEQVNLTKTSQKHVCIGNDYGNRKEFTKALDNDSEGLNENGLARATIGLDWRTIERGGIKHKIWELAGQDRMQKITGTYYSGADSILIFDSPKLTEVDAWIAKAKQKCPEDSQLYWVRKGAHGPELVPCDQFPHQQAEEQMYSQMNFSICGKLGWSIMDQVSNPPLEHTQAQQADIETQPRPCHLVLGLKN